MFCSLPWSKIENISKALFFSEDITSNNRLGASPFQKIKCPNLWQSYQLYKLHTPNY